MEKIINESTKEYLRNQIKDNKYSEIKHAFSKHELFEISKNSFSFFKVSVTSKLELTKKEALQINTSSLNSLYRRIKKEVINNPLITTKPTKTSSADDKEIDIYKSVIEAETQNQSNKLIIKRVTKNE